MTDAELDAREEEVASLARRAARAASERTQPGGGPTLTVDDIDENMMARLGRAFGRIESSSADFGGAMLFRGSTVQPLVSLLPPEQADDARVLLRRIATGVRAQVDSLVGSSIGDFTDSIVSAVEASALVKFLGDDVLVVMVNGADGDVATIWSAMAAECATIADAAASLVR